MDDIVDTGSGSLSFTMDGSFVVVNAAGDSDTAEKMEVDQVNHEEQKTQKEANEPTEAHPMVPIMDKALCLFHGPLWRAKLQRVFNLIRKTVIPAKYMPMLGKAVCVCQGGHTLIDATTAEMLLDYFRLSPLPVAELLPALAALQGGLEPQPYNPNHWGKYRLLLILHEAIVERDFFLLEPRKLNVESAANPKTEPEFYELTFDLDLPRLHLGLLFGSKGRRIKLMCDRYNSRVKVHALPRYPFRKAGVVKDELKVTLRSKEKGKVEEFEKALAEMAVKIRVKREAHSKRMQQYAENKFKRFCNRRRYKQRAGVVRQEEQKEQAADDFLNKLKYHGKDRGRHGHQSASAAKPGNILQEGSRCLQCLAPHPKNPLRGSAGHSTGDSEGESVDNDDVQLVDEGKKAGQVCRYHPGYIAEEKQWLYKLEWTCCQVEVPSREQSVQQDSHMNTGCAVGIHNWRPTRVSTKRGTGHAGKGREVNVQTVNRRLKQKAVSGREAIAMATDLQY